MRIGGILLLTFLLCFSFDAKSQNAPYPWALGIHPSMFRFVDLNVGDVPGGQKYDFGVQFSFARYLNKSFDLGLEGAFALLQHPSGLTNIEGILVPRDNFYSIQPFVKYKINNGYILPEKLFIGPFLKGGFGVNKSASAENPGIYFPLAIGLNFRLGKIAALEIQTTYNLSLQEAEDYFQSSVGLIVHFKGKVKKPFKNLEDITDTDHDGVPDFLDKCPTLAGLPEGKGCPDQDGDGVFDDSDECPVVKGYANLVGCIDSDHDGLIDTDDSCPHEYGHINHEGCPHTALDSDNDRIVDSEDACPDLPGLFTAKGCPDADGDGIRDSEDSCPDEYGDADKGGCPSRTKTSVPPVGPVLGPVTSFMAMEQSKVCEKQYLFLEELGRLVLFESNSAKVSPSSFPALDKIGEVMNGCDVHKLLITAHTDSDGNPAFNMALSSERAYAVKAYLMQAGVKGNRLVVAPFGETQPLYPNDTESHKRLNRRVEFTLFQ